MGKIILISLKLNFFPNTLSCYGLIHSKWSRWTYRPDTPILYVLWLASSARLRDGAWTTEDRKLYNLWIFKGERNSIDWIKYTCVRTMRWFALIPLPCDEKRKGGIAAVFCKEAALGWKCFMTWWKEKDEFARQPEGYLRELVGGGKRR